MSYPQRHPMGIPGLTPMPPGMVPQAYGFSHLAPMMPMGMMPAHMMPPGIQVPPLSDVRMMSNNRPHQIQRRPVPLRRSYEDQRKMSSGPTITVFVGNITDRAVDGLVKQLLQKCGSVVSWKRVQGASGRLQGFGFCDYGDPESALRAIRLLHDWEIGEKKLVVKVDAKTKAQLDEYKAIKKKARMDLMDGAGGKTPTESEREDEEELDDDTRKEDSIIRTGIQVLLREHEYDLSRPVAPPEHRKRSSKTNDSKNPASEEADDRVDKDNLDEMDLEEEKKSLIHREIDKFRDTMKKQEEEKEKERERRERDRDRRDRDRRDGPPPPPPPRQPPLQMASTNRLHSRPPPEGPMDRPQERPYDRSRSRSRDRDRERSREREREREERSRERENANIERAREKEYDRDKREKDKEREREEEEEAYERRKLERKLREKEAAYQERLRNWETRERKKAREYEKYKEKEEERRLDETKEAKRLKEFLEDYDDERDDPKFYKGSMLTRRLKEREKEMEADNRDRQREKEELEELRQKLMEEGHPDPNAELERIKKEAEEKFKPLIKAEPEKPKAEYKPKPTVVHVPKLDDGTKVVRKTVVPDDDTNTQNSLSGVSDITTPKEEMKPKALHGFAGLKLAAGDSSEATPVAPAAKEEPKPKLMGFSGLKLGSSPTHSQPTSGSGASGGGGGGGGGGSNSKRKKLTVGEVFNTDEDENTDGHVRKRKLVPLDYSEDEKKAVGGSGDGQSTAASGNSNQEEKRKHIKNLIDKIPTEKDKLFAYGIDWTIVDNVLMERRIRPWINKKIVEYIGEEEPTLVDFICSKLMAGSTPQSILDDVQMVLDDEAEVFVVKMWRLLIYEIEAKKLGLVK